MVYTRLKTHGFLVYVNLIQFGVKQKHLVAVFFFFANGVFFPSKNSNSRSHKLSLLQTSDCCFFVAKISQQWWKLAQWKKWDFKKPVINILSFILFVWCFIFKMGLLAWWLCGKLMWWMKRAHGWWRDTEEREWW